MHRIPYINCLLLICFMATSIFLVAHKRTPIDYGALPLPKPPITDLPKSPFTQALNFSSQGPLSLSWAPPSLELPDLREEIIFQGTNKRPDASANKDGACHIGLRSDQKIKSVGFGEKIYLKYDFAKTTEIPARPFNEGALWNEPRHSFSKGRYLFSPDNEKTPLWIELSRPKNNPQGNQIGVQVSMLNETGSVITAPETLRHFALFEQGNKPHRFSFNLDGMRVDSTLLVRQRARWFGQDLFLQKHGGEEFAHLKSKQRIDFLTEQNCYSCFIEERDRLIWKEGRWVASDETHGYPLLVVKKIDERNILFDLWDPMGKGKVSLTLVRAKQGRSSPPVEQIFRFIGAKTWAQFIVECQGERLSIKSGDWLLFKEGRWKKLTTEKQIDEYVNRCLLGPMIVFEKMEKQEGQQVLIGHLFDATRTELVDIALRAETSFFAKPPSYASLPPRLHGNNVASENGVGLIREESNQ